MLNTGKMWVDYWGGRVCCPPPPLKLLGGGAGPLPPPPPLPTPMKYLTSILLIFLLLCKNITGSKVGSYKGGHIASTLQRDIRTRLKKRNRSTALGRSKIQHVEYWGRAEGPNMFYWIKTLALVSAVGRNIWFA